MDVLADRIRQILKRNPGKVDLRVLLNSTKGYPGGKSAHIQEILGTVHGVRGFQVFYDPKGSGTPIRGPRGPITVEFQGRQIRFYEDVEVQASADPNSWGVYGGQI